eukprot:XP_008190120.1 PREDICTED: KRAB-A domain-containing protein 2-like [Acyrthosiphon pisum]
MEHEVNTKYKNITRDMIMPYINSCESCQKKGSTAKNRVGGKTNYMNVAYVLLDIFTTFGAPSILHLDNGREFANKVVTEMCAMWPELKIVHGKPRHSQSQGSVERVNQDIENMLATWLTDNPKIGLKSTLLPINIISDLRTEEDLETALNSVFTTSNSNNDIENTEVNPENQTSAKIDTNQGTSSSLNIATPENQTSD